MKIGEAWKLRILYFLVFCCTASWLPIIADYLNDRGLTGIQTGIILGITPMMMFLVQPLYGMLADRLGYKKCLLLSSVLAAFSYVFYLFDGGFLYLFVITVFMSVFYNTIQPLLDSLSLNLVQRNPKFSYGTLRIAGAVGWMLTGIITGQVVDAVDTTAIFIVSAISMLLTFFFSFALTLGNEKKVVVETQSYKNIKELLVNRELMFLLTCVFLISAGTSTIWYFYFIYMQQNGASASLAGYGISFQGLCELPLFYFSARIIRRLGVKTTLLVTITASALRMFLYSITKNPQTALLIELLHGISWSLFWVVCVESVNKMVREEWRATGQSLLYAAYFGAGVIAGNFWTGYLSDSKMKISEVFLLNAGIVFCVGVLVLIFMKRTEEKLAPNR